ncbi:MAG: hypothetical protein M0Q91_10095 [Methanoregula sp.]|jgi:hypothetical protein|nr:hypothetical protein [Methanoregula sp.]
MNDKICPFMSRHVIAGIREHVDYEGYKPIITEFHTVYCLKELCMAWRPEKTNLVEGDPAYHGMEDKTLTYPEHCVLMSHNEPIFPTIEKVVRQRGE